MKQNAVRLNEILSNATCIKPYTTLQNAVRMSELTQLPLDKIPIDQMPFYNMAFVMLEMTCGII